jgi:hypothetical protein
MTGQSEAYRKLDREWRTTCRVLLGDEIGELDEYSKWLSGLNDPLFVRPSSVSGKPVVLSNGAYCESGKAVRMDDIDFTRKFEPLSINDMKDIDSLLSAVRGKLGRSVRQLLCLQVSKDFGLQERCLLPMDAPVREHIRHK